MKKIITAILCFCMILSFSSVSYAQENAIAESNNDYVVLDFFFENPDECIVYAKDGVTDITDKFYADYIHAYLSGEHKLIEDYAKNQVSCIAGPVTVERVLANEGNAARGSNDYFLAQRQFVQYPTCEITGRQNCTFVGILYVPVYVNNNQGYINSAGTPYVVAERNPANQYEWDDDTFTTRLETLSANSYVASDGSYVDGNVICMYYVNVHAVAEYMPVYLAYRYRIAVTLRIPDYLVVTNPQN